MPNPPRKDPNEKREDTIKDRFRDLLFQHGLTKEMAAELLYVSVWTVDAWLKPAHIKSSNPVPAWAPELLLYKLNDPNLHVEGLLNYDPWSRLQQREPDGTPTS